MRVFVLFIMIGLLAGGVLAQGGTVAPVTFMVTIENISGTGRYSNYGIADIPFGLTEPGPAWPENGYEFSFSAQPGDRLTFATMLAISNDIFFSPAPEGLALFDEQGAPLNGTITDQIFLWDLGSEQNEQVGLGEFQPLYETDPNSGIEEDGVVRLVSALDDGNRYPATADMLDITIQGDSDGNFTVRLDNVSENYEVSTPITPVLWIIYPAGDSSESGILFTPGEADYGYGLEALAENGAVDPLLAYVAGSSLHSALSPVVYIVGDDVDSAFFSAGEADRGVGLESLAEDGDPLPLAAAAGAAIVTEDEPLAPGSSYSFTVEAVPGQSLSFVVMLLESNDLFFAPLDGDIALFDEAGNPVSGDVTRQVRLWDAGTEVNQIPGSGADQAPRQQAPDSGADEMGSVQLVKWFSRDTIYPPAASLIRVTIQ